jgi:hypothetical protein
MADAPVVAPVTPAAAPAAAPAGGDDANKRLSGLTKTVNEFIAATGAANKDEAMAKIRAFNEAAAKPAASDPPAASPASSDGRPMRPRLSQFTDPDTGLQDTAAFDAAMDKYETESDAYRSRSASEGSAKAQAAAAVDSAVGALPAWMKGDDENDDSVLHREAIEANARRAAGGKTPTVAQVQSAAQQYVAAAERANARRLAENDAAAAASRAGEPGRGAGGAPAGPPAEDNEPIHPPTQNPDEMQSYIKSRLKRSRGG